MVHKLGFAVGHRELNVSPEHTTICTLTHIYASKTWNVPSYSLDFSTKRKEIWDARLFFFTEGDIIVVIYGLSPFFLLWFISPTFHQLDNVSFISSSCSIAFACMRQRTDVWLMYSYKIGETRRTLRDVGFETCRNCVENIAQTKCISSSLMSDNWTGNAAAECCHTCMLN